MKLPKLINQVIPCIQIWQQGFNLALFFLPFFFSFYYYFFFFFFFLAINEDSWEEIGKKKKDVFIPQYGKEKKKSPLHYLQKLNAMTTF